MNASQREFEVEIDRSGLHSFKRAQNLIWWALFLGIFLGISFLGSLDSIIEQGNVMEGIASWLGIGLGIYFVAVMIAYLVFSHGSSRRYAESLRVRVDGPFLVIRTGKKYRTERKIHFRAISDYFSTESPLMRHFGIQAVGIYIVGAAQGRSTVIHGVANADEVRDLLCQVDAEREGNST